jgi:acetyl esterase/lipase
MTFLIVALIIIALIAIIYYGGAHLYLKGADHSKYDTEPEVTFKSDEPSEGVERVNTHLRSSFTEGESLSAKRKRFNEGGLTRQFDAEFKADTVKANGLDVPGEWTLVEGADPSKRLLYLHGGAFTVGSPISHRPITYNLAKRTGCAVFAPDYRLMPENPRAASIEDSQASYDWILENGPEGAAKANKIAVAGDSAGGNLTLMLSNWVSETGRRMPDAVIGISPSTDGSATSRFYQDNFDTDVMLQPLLKPLLKLPQELLLWGMWKAMGMRPSDPKISPLHADLRDLPPTLIHASASEMLYGDAVRYFNKATAVGSDVTFQSWQHTCHVWHIFDEMHEEAHHALDEIASFMKAQGI